MKKDENFVYFYMVVDKFYLCKSESATSIVLLLSFNNYLVYMVKDGNYNPLLLRNSFMDKLYQKARRKTDRIEDYN